MANKKREKPKHLGRGLASLFDPITSGGAEAVLESGQGTLSAETEPQMPETKSEPGTLSAETEPQMPETKSEPRTLSAETVLQMLKTKSGLGMLRTKTALGIDISETLISLALLERKGDDIELLTTASCPVPDGAIKNGNINDPVQLSEAINELKSSNKIRSNYAAVSLRVKPVVMQIMDTPKQVSSSINQFIHKEVKHYVSLTGKEILSDFCGVSSGGRTIKSRLFAVATNSEKVSELVKVCNQAHLNLRSIEPPLLAYARAFYTKKIAGKFDSNVLLAVLDNSILTLCVFRNETIDFVRTKEVNSKKDEPDKICQWLADEINKVIQYYNVEVPDCSGKWEITVIPDSVQLPKDAEESLKAKITDVNLHVETPQVALQDIPVGQSRYIGTDIPSPIAIGLAMKLLGINGSNLRINLLPPEAVEVKAAKKDILIAANILAAMFLLMVLAIGVLTLTTAKFNRKIAHDKQAQLYQNTHALLKEREMIDGQIKQLSDRPNRLNQILNSRDDVDWVHILNEIRNGTPKNVRITNLFSKGSSKISLEGFSMSYEGVRLFVDMLNQSKHINSASLIETEKDENSKGLVRYVINCSLITRKEI
jgi:Tfp pilus assembly protein PilN